MDISFALENTEALPVIYNRAIKESLRDGYDCLVFIHDDVILEENPFPKLETLFDTYDLVGLAGASRIELKSPALWHLMGGGFDGGHLHGNVQHLQIINHPMGMVEHKKPATYFGPYPHRVVMIDGVFMALNLSSVKSFEFDEDNPSKFHFYDILLSLDVYFKKMKIGVGDILITHESPGLREFTEDWRVGEDYFLKTYGSI